MGNQSHKLSDNEVHFLDMITIFKKDEIKKCYVDFMNKVPDGKMDLPAFKRFLHSFGQDIQNDFAEHYFRNIDKDGSGKITFQEFLLYLSSEGSAKPADRIMWLFDLFDIDESGFINRKEMATIFESALKMTKDNTHTATTAEKITDDIFDRYDKDKNEALERHEFQEAILGNPQVFSMFPVLYDAIFKDRA